MGKDVEGLTHQYIFNMYQNIRFLDDAHQKKSVLPCTPLACLKILEGLHIYNPILSYGNRLHGHTITVINRSEVVGRPLAALLANDGARVYSVDINDVQEYTRGQGLRKRRHTIIEKPGQKLEDCLPLSDVVISGVPGDDFKVPVDLLREGAVCINFSTQRVRMTQCSSHNNVTNRIAELRQRQGQRKSVNLRSGDRRGHDRCTPTKPFENRPESSRGPGGET